MKKSFIKPEKIINELGIKQGMMVADFGCGAGAWTIPAAFLVGDSGEVYAFDMLPHMLELTGSRVKKFNLKNVQLIKADIEAPIELPKKIKIKEKSCDLVIISNILFQLKDKESVFANVEKVIKKDGRALVIDWQTDAIFGPDKNLRLKKDDIKGIAKKHGFILDQEIDAGHFHYGLVFNLTS